MCGDGEVEEAEECDGGDLDGRGCTDFPGEGGGTLECTAVCQFDLGGCCLADGQACQSDGQCCGSSCKFDLLLAKNICK